jgi:hypothetical protein
MLLAGVRGQPMQAVRAAVCCWPLTFESPQQWNTVGKWLRAVSEERLYPQVRGWPPAFDPRQRAERVATTLLSYAPGALAHCTLEEQVFVGAGLAA